MPSLFGTNDNDEYDGNGDGGEPQMMNALA
jgi:hypothetical protein